MKPTAIVMDIEGAETAILQASSLNGVKKLVLELHPHIAGEAAIIALRAHLQKLGFFERRAIHKSSLFIRS